MSKLKKLNKPKINRKLIGKFFIVVGIGIIITGIGMVTVSNIKEIKQLKSHNTKLKNNITLERQVKKALKDENIELNNKKMETEEKLSKVKTNIEEKDNEIQTLKKKLDSLKKDRSSRQTVSSRGGQVESVSRKGNWITMRASAYTNSPSENGGYSTTAMGDTLVFGMVAVDPNFLPLGTRINIEGYGHMVFKCSDTGGAIKGNRIDILLNSKSEAIQFGRRQVRIRVVK